MLKDNIHRRSKLQELKAAKDYKGKTTPGSGNQWVKKADVTTDHFLVECKSTLKKSYSLKHDDLKKLYYQSVLDNKVPVFEIDFDGDQYVILSKSDFTQNMHLFDW
jgi:hypothetical protein